MSLGGELDVLKEIPGYKAILKSVIKTQIQLLVEQLSDQTGEESIIITASINEGTLSHLGSNMGKGFFEGRDEIKSQFLGYCLKNSQRKTRGASHQSDYETGTGPPAPKRPKGKSYQDTGAVVEIDDSEPHYVPQKIQSYSRHTGVDNDSSLFNLEESGEKQNTSTSIVQGFSYSDVQIKTSSDNFPAASFSQISHTSRHERDDHSEQSDFARSKDTSLESIVKIEPGAENEHEFIVAGISGYQGDLGQGDTGEMGYQTLESGEQSMSQSSFDDADMKSSSPSNEGIHSESAKTVSLLADEDLTSKSVTDPSSGEGLTVKHATMEVLECIPLHENTISDHMDDERNDEMLVSAETVLAQPGITMSSSQSCDIPYSVLTPTSSSLTGYFEGNLATAVKVPPLDYESPVYNHAGGLGATTNLTDGSKDHGTSTSVSYRPAVTQASPADLFAEGTTCPSIKVFNELVNNEHVVEVQSAPSDMFSTTASISTSTSSTSLTTLDHISRTSVPSLDYISSTTSTTSISALDPVSRTSVPALNYITSTTSTTSVSALDPVSRTSVPALNYITSTTSTTSVSALDPVSRTSVPALNYITSTTSTTSVSALDPVYRTSVPALNYITSTTSTTSVSALDPVSRTSVPALDYISSTTSTTSVSALNPMSRTSVPALNYITSTTSTTSVLALDPMSSTQVSSTYSVMDPLYSTISTTSVSALDPMSSIQLSTTYATMDPTSGTTISPLEPTSSIISRTSVSTLDPVSSIQLSTTFSTMQHTSSTTLSTSVSTLDPISSLQLSTTFSKMQPIANTALSTSVTTPDPVSSPISSTSISSAVSINTACSVLDPLSSIQSSSGFSTMDPVFSITHSTTVSSMEPISSITPGTSVSTLDPLSSTTFSTLDPISSITISGGDAVNTGNVSVSETPHTTLSLISQTSPISQTSISSAFLAGETSDPATLYTGQALITSSSVGQISSPTMFHINGPSVTSIGETPGSAYFPSQTESVVILSNGGEYGLTMSSTGETPNITTSSTSPIFSSTSACPQTGSSATSPADKSSMTATSEGEQLGSSGIQTSLSVSVSCTASSLSVGQASAAIFGGVRQSPSFLGQSRPCNVVGIGGRGPNGAQLQGFIGAPGSQIVRAQLGTGQPQGTMEQMNSLIVRLTGARIFGGSVSAGGGPVRRTFISQGTAGLGGISPGYNRRTVAPYSPVLAQNIARRQGGPVLVRSNTRTQSSYSIDQLHLRGSGTATQTSIQQQISTSGTVSQIGQGFGRVQLGVPGSSIQTGHVIARQNLGVGGTAVQASYNLHQQQSDGGNIGTLGIAPGRRRDVSPVDYQRYVVNEKGKRVLVRCCGVCGKDFRKKGEFIAHQKTHARKGTELYKCLFCTRGFIQMEQLKQHLQYHKESAQIDNVCHLCNKRLCKRDSLKSHLWRIHKAPLPP